jgi:invasion protein IalB
MRIPFSILIIGLITMTFSGNGLAITDGQNFQDWRSKCVTNRQAEGAAPAITTCHVFQDLLHKESGKRILHIAIGKLPDQEKYTFIVTLPLGIALPQGLTLRIDGQHAIKQAIQACFTTGCQAAFQPDKQWINHFKAGKEAEAIFHNIQNQAISIPVSLKGVTAALQALDAAR